MPTSKFRGWSSTNLGVALCFFALYSVGGGEDARFAAFRMVLCGVQFAQKLMATGHTLATIFGRTVSTLRSRVPSGVLFHAPLLYIVSIGLMVPCGGPHTIICNPCTSRIGRVLFIQASETRNCRPFTHREEPIDGSRLGARKAAAMTPWRDEKEQPAMAV